jgi:hypothetical protein
MRAPSGEALSAGTWPGEPPGAAPRGRGRARARRGGPPARGEVEGQPVQTVVLGPRGGRQSLGATVLWGEWLDGRCTPRRRPHDGLRRPVHLPGLRPRRRLLGDDDE